MDRQVDVKAIVSHLVRGDGLHKCRICMGDTSDGQVFLGDTVMSDGDRPVTLAELLETITGVEVPMDDCLPSRLCAVCSKASIDAANFITLCRDTTNQWENTLNHLSEIPKKSEENKTAMFAVLNINNDTVEFYTDKLKVLKTPAQRLTRLLTRKSVEVTNPQFSCLNCGKKFKYAQHYFLHLKESTDLKRACHVCGKVMIRDELVEHLKITHNRAPYDCKKCPAISITEKTYIQHKKLAHTSGACTCGDCGRSFKTLTSYHGHSTVHSSKSCPECNKIFRNHACYLHHAKKCFTIKPDIEEKKEVISQSAVDIAGSRCICDYCGKSLAGKKFIQAHIQNVHLKSNHRTCDYCGKLYLAAYMQEHIKSHEMTKPAYVCEHCSLPLRTKLGYIQHLRLHTGEKPFECKHCGERFSGSSRRSEHIRKVHNSGQVKLKHICEKCGAQFKIPSLLRQHIATVHESNKRCKIKCLRCMKKFYTQNELEEHEKSHEEVPQTIYILPNKRL